MLQDRRCEAQFPGSDVIRLHEPQHPAPILCTRRGAIGVALLSVVCLLLPQSPRSQILSAAEKGVRNRFDTLAYEQGIKNPSGEEPQEPRRKTVPDTFSEVRLCQALGPAAPCPIRAVDCGSCCPKGWESARIIAWQAYAQGEYAGHERLAHVPEYRLRVDDELDLVYRLTRNETPEPYRMEVGDEIQVESFTDPDLNRSLIIQPDGTITLRLLGQVKATGLTVPQLRSELEGMYNKYYKIPAITVTPLKVNTRLEDLRAAVDRRYGAGGQNRLARVTPEGTISLPAIGSILAQGLALPELQKELNERYREAGIEGMEVIPVLLARAPRFVFVVGEVGAPGRYELTGPTTLLQAIALAGSWKVGANLRQVVVFRRGDDWRLMATMVNVGDALCGKQPCSPGEIWLNDSDVVIVPKGALLVANDFIEQVFTRGIYGVFPMFVSLNFSKLSTL
jgi:polysaccharide export outer membrane protein